MGVLNDFGSAFVDVASEAAAYEVVLRFAAVLAFAAVGEWVAEKAGTLNVSLEAMMLGGAFFAAVGYDLTGSFWAGLGFAIAAGWIVAFIQANMSHRLGVNQFVIGLTLNILVLALVGFLLTNLEPESRTAANINFGILAEIPFIGQILFEQSWPFYLVFLMGVLAWWLLYGTRWGLEVRAVGENPESARRNGIPVLARRCQAVYFCGISAGLGGGYLLLGQVGRFETEIVGGQGFIAIAAVIFGGWRLRGIVLGCLLFGIANSFKLTLPALGHPLNSELLASLPFILPLLGLAIVARYLKGRQLQPAALGNF